MGGIILITSVISADTNAFDSDLPPVCCVSFLQSLGNSQREYEKHVLLYSIRNQLRFRNNLGKEVNHHSSAKCARWIVGDIMIGCEIKRQIANKSCSVLFEVCEYVCWLAKFTQIKVT